MPSLCLLAIETSTDACSVALSVDGQIQETFEILPKAHTRLLLPMVETLCQASDIPIEAIDVFALGRGPGSFTGIRIAFSVVQALSFGLDKPVVPVSTLHALAEGAFLMHPNATEICAYLDARLGEIYWGLFKKAPDDASKLCGVGEERLSSLEVLEILPAGCVKITGYPHAADVAKIALSAYKNGQFYKIQDIMPVYLSDEVVKKQS